MCAGASADELFLADCVNSVLRVFDVRTGQLDARDVYRCPAEEQMLNVAYCAHTDTLFVATWGYAPTVSYRVRSLGRTNAEWRECHRLDLSRHKSSYFPDVTLRALSDGSLAFGEHCSAELQLVAVDDSRAMQTRARIPLPGAHEGFDAQFAAGETRLAVALRTPKRAVALFRVAGDRAEELTRCALDCRMRPLFWRDSLLSFVHTDNGNCVVQELSSGTGGGRLEPRRVLLSGLKDSSNCWCVVNDSLLAAWDIERETHTLTLYNI